MVAPAEFMLARSLRELMSYAGHVRRRRSIEVSIQPMMNRSSEIGVGANSVVPIR